MRINDRAVPRAALAAVSLLLMSSTACLMWLEAGKTKHQSAGFHQPTAEEQCYMTPGHGQLATLQDITFCVTH